MTIKIITDDGIEFRFYHVHNLLVKEGDKVVAGQMLGYAAGAPIFTIMAGTVEMFKPILTLV